MAYGLMLFTANFPAILIIYFAGESERLYLVGKICKHYRRKSAVMGMTVFVYSLVFYLTYLKLYPSHLVLVLRVCYYANEQWI